MKEFFLVAGAFLAAGIFWYILFYRREKKLMARLQNMVDAASQNEPEHFARSEISESRLSLLENSMKRFLDDNTLSAELSGKQKETVQSLLSDIAHQTLTPISNLKLYSELLLEDPRGHQAELSILQEETEKLDFLIQSLVMLSRLENGILSMRRESTSVETLLQAVYQEYLPAAKAKNISLQYTCEPELSAGFDLKWTREALGNVVDNAIKYTDSGGQVTISAKKNTFFACIEVADTGIGIEEGELHQIFSRFYRSFSVADSPGVGIGLYLARQIIEAEKGFIHAASVPGKGSVFTIYLHL